MGDGERKCTYCGKLLHSGVWYCPDCWVVNVLSCTPNKHDKQNKRDSYNDYLKKVVK